MLTCLPLYFLPPKKEDVKKFEIFKDFEKLKKKLSLWNERDLHVGFQKKPHIKNAKLLAKSGGKGKNYIHYKSQTLFGYRNVLIIFVNRENLKLPKQDLFLPLQVGIQSVVWNGDKRECCQVFGVADSVCSSRDQGKHRRCLGKFGGEIVNFLLVFRGTLRRSPAFIRQNKKVE